MADVEDWKVPKRLQPERDAYDYDLDQALQAVVSLDALIPQNALTANILGTERTGHGVVIDEAGVVLTIGYLITEAEEVQLTTASGRRIPAHVLGYDQPSGFGVLQALDPLDLPAIPLGNSSQVSLGERVVMAGGGGRAKAVAARLVARQEFAGYWEYLLDEALFTSPGHPLWSGAALIGASGELIGIGSLRLEQETPEGRNLPLNMSVPIERLQPIYEDLLKGRPTAPARPWLGMLSQEVEDVVMVVGVSDGSPALRAGLRQGDVVVAIAGERVSDLAGLYRRLWALGPAGVVVPLTLRRGGDVFDVEVRSADRTQLLTKPRFH